MEKAGTKEMEEVQESCIIEILLATDAQMENGEVDRDLLG